MQRHDGDGLVQLEIGLREAIKHRGVDDRRAAVLALGAVLDFLYSLRHLTAENLHRPLYDLLAALDDLNKGRVAPMLTPAQFGNRPPDGATFRQAKGFALFAAQQLVERGDSVAAACRKVSQVWNKEVPHLGRTPETIRSWYRRSSRLPNEDPEKVTLAELQRAIEQDSRFQGADFLAALSVALRQIAVAIGE